MPREGQHAKRRGMRDPADADIQCALLAFCNNVVDRLELAALRIDENTTRIDVDPVEIDVIAREFEPGRFLDDPVQRLGTHIAEQQREQSGLAIPMYF